MLLMVQLLNARMGHTVFPSITKVLVRIMGVLRSGISDLDPGFSPSVLPPLIILLDPV